MDPAVVVVAVVKMAPLVLLTQKHMTAAFHAPEAVVAFVHVAFVVAFVMPLFLEHSLVIVSD